MPIMTINYYKNKIESLTIACEVVAWKSATRMWGKEIINRYEPKSYLKFRIEAAFEFFDEGLSKIIASRYRIGELKAENSID